MYKSVIEMMMLASDHQNKLLDINKNRPRIIMFSPGRPVADETETSGKLGLQ